MRKIIDVICSIYALSIPEQWSLERANIRWWSLNDFSIIFSCINNIASSIFHELSFGFRILTKNTQIPRRQEDPISAICVTKDSPSRTISTTTRLFTWVSANDSNIGYKWITGRENDPRKRIDCEICGKNLAVKSINSHMRMQHDGLFF